MYLLSLIYENAKWNGNGEFCFEMDRREIRKWTLLPVDRRGRELLRLMGLACAGIRFVPRLRCRLGDLRRNRNKDIHCECAIVRHSPIERQPHIDPIRHIGIRIDDLGRAEPLRCEAHRMAGSGRQLSFLASGHGIGSYFLLGYGPILHAHGGMDDFDFNDPYHRVRRFLSLFDGDARITDPVAFLRRLHYKGVRVSRFPAQKVLVRFRELLGEICEVDAQHWFEKGCDFDEAWYGLRPWQRRVLLPVLDAVRHMMDAFPRSGSPLEMPGVMLFDRPDRYCTEQTFSRWVDLVDRLFPAMQCVLTLSDESRSCVPDRAVAEHLPLPAAEDRPKSRCPMRLPADTVLLVDVDSRLPNLALMKLSSHFKRQRRKVHLARKDNLPRGAEEVWASCVFSTSFSSRRIESIRNRFGSAAIGGTGVDLRRRLPAEIEGLPADYSLYPELGDRAIGFLTRGCPYRCAHCVVPVKEGAPRQVSDFDDLVQGDRKKLILLDDNILSHPRATELLETMVELDLHVNFNQTLDIRLVDQERARLLRRIRCTNTRFTRSNHHFSLNDTGNLDQVRRKYALFGFTPRANVEFICMYGYNTSLAEDVERFRFLRSLPGAYVFMQEYLPIPGGPMPMLDDFFDERADELLDELVGIVFTQNMKSMEKYYRWVSRLYAETFGTLHDKLVDTIFRYNNRHRRGLYIATLAGTRV